MGGQRRLSQIFVEIPPPATSNYPPHVPSSRKENPLRASASKNTIMSMNTSSKRKQDETHDQPSKKAKVETTSVKPNATRRPLANATLDFPNGFVYCHQCNKKRDAAITAQCTFEDAKSRRCIAKYCAPCLKNRYGITLQDVLSTNTVPLDQKKQHISGEGYFFKCPRCEEMCNCVHCRKAKGLAPTGNLTLTARTSGFLSAADVLLHDPNAAGPMAGKTVAGKKPRARKPPPQPTTTAAAGKSKSRSTKGTPHISTLAPLPTTKPLPKALWTPIRTHLSLHGAEARIHIREFALRFLPLSRAHLDELEFISRSHRNFDDDEDGDLEPWVSEGCLKALLIALLSMVEVDAKTLSTTTGALHHHWFLFKIVETLHTFSTLSSVPLPSPIPAPEHLLQSVPIIRTRSSRNPSHPQAIKQTSNETGWPEVVRTSQLIPVISALVDQAVQGQAVRDVLEEGAKEAKDLTKESIELKKVLERAEKDKKEREKIEKEQASKDKKGKGKNVKGKGRVHAKGKDVKSIEDEPRHTLTPKTALTIALSSCAHRIAPLGQDTEGRVYWTLTPGRGERDASREYLTSNVEVEQQDEASKTKSKATKSRSAWTPPSLTERASHKRWSWFVAVWGIRPCMEERRDPPKDEDDSEDDSSESEFEHDSETGDDEGQENKIKPRKNKTEPERPGWYAFSDPSEIFKLAEWVDRKAGHELHSPSSKKSNLRPISALPSRAASTSTSRAVSASNTRTSAFTSRAALSLSNKFKATHTHSKLSGSPLTDVEVISSSEVEDSEEELDFADNEPEFSGEYQNIEDKGAKRDDGIAMELDDMPRTPQLQSLVLELRAYAELLKKRTQAET